MKNVSYKNCKTHEEVDRVHAYYLECLEANMAKEDIPRSLYQDLERERQEAHLRLDKDYYHGI